MSRLPNPFTSGQGHHQYQRPQSTPPPSFLIMTRAASGANMYGGGTSRHSHSSPLHRSSSDSANNYISFSGGGQEGNRRGGGGGGRGRFNRGGSRSFGGEGSPRFAHPYKHSPVRLNNNPYGHNHGFSSTPRHRSGDHSNFNSFSNSKRGRNRGPLTDIPIDKFVSHNMVQNPWAEFVVEEEVDVRVHNQSSSDVVNLDDSEIIIDSDASANTFGENSYEEGASGNEGDSSPVHDGSDSPYVATSSTSEKDTGSDSMSDA
ncbi:uncharacterized protein LOC121863080 [Homarus americanus]|uniref:Uncharacterized protein n=1 Tax=Homarus americanus TaxID=6706 RepID=A0A8J5N1J0_HOMAM|nr:uncharacterized protein LOC121863080 [Homarus americanus]KAG7171499.1 hypothetical protein Hamer_G018620 [Homarus americanus]